MGAVPARPRTRRAPPRARAAAAAAGGTAGAAPAGCAPAATSPPPRTCPGPSPGPATGQEEEKVGKQGKSELLGSHSQGGAHSHAARTETVAASVLKAPPAALCSCSRCSCTLLPPSAAQLRAWTMPRGCHASRQGQGPCAWHTPALLCWCPTPSSDSSPVPRLSSSCSISSPEGGDPEMLSGMEHAGAEGTALGKGYQLSQDTCISWACCSMLGLGLGFRLRLRLRPSTALPTWAISSPAHCSTASSTTSSGSRSNYAPTLTSANSMREQIKTSPVSNYVARGEAISSQGGRKSWGKAAAAQPCCSPRRELGQVPTRAGTSL